LASLENRQDIEALYIKKINYFLISMSLTFLSASLFLNKLIYFITQQIFKMKKSIKLILLVFIVSTISSGCSKKNEDVSPKLSAQAKMSKSDYLHYMESLRPAKPQKFLSVGGLIVGDVFGGLGGVGGGEWLAGGPLAPEAAAFCFLCGAAAGSGLVGIQCIVPNSGPNVVPCSSCNTNAFGNPENPYDYIGYCHNQVLYTVFSSLPSYETKDGNLNVTAFYNLSASIYSINQGIDVGLLNKDYPINYFSYYDSLLLNGNTKYGSIPNYLQSSLSSNIAADSFVVSALQDYITTINTFNDYTSLYNYSVQVENALLKTNVSATDQQYLLSSYAVGRYSTGFWLNSYKP
jgi:hypothetical protein